MRLNHKTKGKYFVVAAASTFAFAGVSPAAAGWSPAVHSSANTVQVTAKRDTIPEATATLSEIMNPASPLTADRVYVSRLSEYGVSITMRKVVSWDMSDGWVVAAATGRVTKGNPKKYLAQIAKTRKSIESVKEGKCTFYLPPYARYMSPASGHCLNGKRYTQVTYIGDGDALAILREATSYLSKQSPGLFDRL